MTKGMKIARSMVGVMSLIYMAGSLGWIISTYMIPQQDPGIQIQIQDREDRPARTVRDSGVWT